MNLTILRFDSINSTNTEALNQAKQGADEGLCIVANEQTAGRGRHGRIWISEKDAGLYFSIVLRPTIENKFLPLLTLMSAVAVYEVLLKLYKLKPDIKWANDVQIGEKKICGILAEMTETKRGLAVVVGIGINLKSSNFPPELKAIATSIEQEINQKIDSDELLENLTKQLTKYYQILTNENGAEKIRQEWANRSTYFRGKSVTAKLENESVSGTTCGLEESGALLIETGNGEIKIIHAGVVERVRKNG
ncbi:MAG: biotin--[acetyl-CoA-carboxylase] ligase [Acidobacteria bacterium]|nr:biotin--[acetyl-CoA-carboxylase] ligase [Acidobacteriota bacterium]